MIDCCLAHVIWTPGESKENTALFNRDGIFTPRRSHDASSDIYTILKSMEHDALVHDERVDVLRDREEGKRLSLDADGPVHDELLVYEEASLAGVLLRNSSDERRVDSKVLSCIVVGELGRLQRFMLCATLDTSLKRRCKCRRRSISGEEPGGYPNGLCVDEDDDWKERMRLIAFPMYFTCDHDELRLAGWAAEAEDECVLAPAHTAL